MNLITDFIIRTARTTQYMPLCNCGLVTRYVGMKFKRLFIVDHSINAILENDDEAVVSFYMTCLHDNRGTTVDVMFENGDSKTFELYKPNGIEEFNNYFEEYHKNGCTEEKQVIINDDEDLIV